MSARQKPQGGLDDTPVSVRMKLSLLWASVMLCYIYCDYFELYQPGKLQSMLSGQFGPLGPTTQATLLGASALLAAPALMVALSTVLPARICRVANIVLGAFYTLVMLAVIPGTWYFFKMFAVIEICLSLSIAWLAFAWPESTGPATSAA